MTYRPHGFLRMCTTVLLAGMLTALALAASVASADSVVCSEGSAAGRCTDPRGMAVDQETGRLYVADGGNHRIDVFAADGSFVMAWGWGVLDGATEFQVCTSVCRTGLVSGGAGAFTQLGDVAVDNDPASPSHHDVYVVDGMRSSGQTDPNLARIQKFTPAGDFLRAWGAGTITGGAQGTGALNPGSKQVTGVVTTKKAFAVGQEITGSGIPPATRITELGAGTITLSKPASAGGGGVVLTAPEGPGHIPTNEIQTITPRSGTFGLSFQMSNPTPSKAETSRRDFSLSTPASGPGSIQEALENLPNIGPGNVSVTGPVAGSFRIEFTGSRFSDTDVPSVIPYGSLEGDAGKTVKNGSSAPEICEAAIAASCTYGGLGAEDGQFGGNVHIAIAPGGDVLVADMADQGVYTPASERYENRVQRFTPDGVFLESHAFPAGSQREGGIAVDSTGNFYLALLSGGALKFDPSGNLLRELPSVLSGAVAGDGAGNLLVSEAESAPSGGSLWKVIAIYDTDGNVVNRFGYGQFGQVPRSFAPFQSANGDLYVEKPGGVSYISIPSPQPVVLPEPCTAQHVGNSRATLRANVNPGGKETSVRFEYMTEAAWKAEGGFSGPDVSATTPVSAGSDFSLHEVSAEATEVAPETSYRCRAVATNEDNESGAFGEVGSFTTLAPLEIGDVWASAIGTDSATLKAWVNPLGIPATGRFQYVDEGTYLADIASLGVGHGFDHAKVAPAGGEIDLGSAEAGESVAAQLSGLAPGASYRFRFQAKNEFIGFRSGEVGTFRTFRTSGQALPDGRAFELVSPASKNGAEVAVPGAAGGLSTIGYSRINAAASAGDAVTYTSFTAFAEPESSLGTNQFLSRRGSGGWETISLSPKGIEANPLLVPFRGFTPDLAYGGVVVSEPPLTPDAVPGYENLYIRDTRSGQLRSLNIERPRGVGSDFCLGLAGMSADGSRGFFIANGALADASEGNGFSLYERDGGGAVRLVSVLPNGSPAPPDRGTSFGRPAGALGQEGTCASAYPNIAGAVSRDGKTAYWTYGGTYKAAKRPLFARMGSETVELDTPVKAVGPAGEGQFWGATPDGGYAFFIAPGRLTATARENGLYRFDAATKSSVSLTPGSGSAGLLGVLGASEAGDVVYFAATAALTGEEVNGSGDKAQDGKPNIYRWQEGEGLHFVATLSPDDGSDWEKVPSAKTSRVSPDGRFLAFLTFRSKELSGYDSSVDGASGCAVRPDGALGGSPLCQQVYLFDADSKILACASCNPSGSRPLGPSVLPTWSNPLAGPRYLSNHGGLLFESLDALLPADVNGKRDVYEAELRGQGTCSAENSNYDPGSHLCLFLISSGGSTDNSYLLDASEDGNDVFFATRQSLVAWDEDENFDVYDARVGGGFPEPPSPSAPCDGEACKPSPGAAPEAAKPATPYFVGSPDQRRKIVAARKHRAKKKHRARAHRAKKHRASKHKGRLQHGYRHDHDRGNR